MSHRKVGRRKWRSCHTVHHSQKVSHCFAVHVHCHLFDGLFIGHAIAPPFLTLSCSPSLWSVKCPAPRESFSCRTPALSRSEEVRTDTSQVCVSGVQLMLMSSSFSLLSPTLWPSSLPCRLQAPASDVKTTDLQKLFNSSYNWVRSNSCNKPLLMILEMNFIETRCLWLIESLLKVVPGVLGMAYP